MPDSERMRINLENIRGIRSLELTFGPHPDGTPGWTVLLGENGAGKTTILRSIALATDAGFELRALARTHDVTMHRWGDEQGSVTLHGPGGMRQVLFPEALSEAGTTLRSAVHRWRILMTDLFAYGSTRGTALGGPDRDVRYGNPRLFADTLFDPNARTIHAETWLRSREHAALKSPGGPAEAFFESVKQTVLALLPGIERLEVGTESVTVQGPAVGECRLEDLADGYLSTLGWTLDLVARWAHANPTEVDGDFTSRIRSLVLVDEVDLHLHPRWQRQLIPDLKRTFPAASFVVTTHNPLTVQTAGPGEVVVLQRDDTGNVTCRQIDPPPGADADDLLTGPWFGLKSTYDGDTVEELEQHAQMLLHGTPADDPARQTLEHLLRHRLSSFADTAEDRAALERAAKSGLSGLAGKLARLKVAEE